MSRDVAVTAEGVSKKFANRLQRAMLYGVQDVVRDLLRLPTGSDRLRRDEFWALQDVSFELQRGDTLGIVGPNGSGKSTLLKMLNGILRPDKGRIHIRGRVGALIEVGAGFHPMLSGRENIYVNGAILGMSKAEIKRKFDSIVDFAEIGDFLDAPVKNYSSGMYVRLGFAVAAHCEPDILLVDEVLAVGDVAFQKKCFRYVEESILGKGVILCLVSHSIYTVSRLCSRAILLNRGAVKYIGESRGIVPEYYKAAHAQSVKRALAGSTSEFEREGAGEVRVRGVEVKDRLGNGIDSIQTGETVEFRFNLHAVRDMPFIPQAFLKISDLSSTVVAYSMIPGLNRDRMRLHTGDNELSCRFQSLNLIPGQYVLEIKLGGGNDLLQDILREAKIFEVVGGEEVYESSGGSGMVYLENEWEMHA